jgi:catechol 2,3-dioxygenase-like lactoylglutathione lyase family enzyme
MAFPPITHIALTVQDLERSIVWYSELFGADPVVEDRHDEFRFAVWLEPSIGIHQFDEPSGVGFDERFSGLDHVAFDCADRTELEVWAERLTALGIEHGEINDAWYGSGLAFRDPDGIALEFFAPATGGNG